MGDATPLRTTTFRCVHPDLQAYTGQAYAALNVSLRTTGAVPKELSKVHERMQSAFEKARPFDPPVKVSRGLTLQEKALTDFLSLVAASHRTGCAFRVTGYVSASVGETPAFMGNVILQIQAVHGLDVMPLTYYPSEREFLINHNSYFRVTGIKKNGSRYIIECDHVLLRLVEGPNHEGIGRRAR